MRTLKKSLALVLALVMVLGLGVVGASADNALDNYTDTGDIGDAYLEAVGVLTGLGIVDGMTDTTIEPDGTYTRAQAAKIVATMLLGVDAADSLKATTAPFEDVPTYHWASGYIAYCVEAGIIDGMTATTFEPEGTLTGFQWAKMLLSAVGFGVNGEFEGDSWSLNTATVGHQSGLFTGDLDGADHVALRREQAMLYAFNALTKLPQVTYSKENTNYLYGILGYFFADGTGHTLGDDTFDLTFVEGQIIDNEGMGNANTIVDNVAYTGRRGSPAEYITVDAGTGLDLMYHAVRLWYVDGKTNTGVYTYDLAKTTVYECMNIAAGDKEAAKLKSVETPSIGYAVGKAEYETYLIDNTALDLANDYAYVSLYADLGTMGRAGSKTTNVDGTAVDNDIILTDVSDIHVGDTIIFIKAESTRSDGEAWYVYPVTTTEGVVKSVHQSAGKVVSVTLTDGTELEMSAFWGNLGGAGDYEVVTGRNYTFVLDTHGDVIYTTRDYARDLYYYTGDSRPANEFNDWSSDRTTEYRFLNVTNGEEYIVPLTDSSLKTLKEGCYYDISASATSSGKYVADIVTPLANAYAEQYVIDTFHVTNGTTGSIANGVNLEDNVVYFDVDEITYIVAKGSGKNMTVETYEGLDELKTDYSVAADGGFVFGNACFTVSTSTTGHKYAEVVFIHENTLTAYSNYVFVPEDIDVDNWNVVDGDPDSYTITYEGAAYLEGKSIDITFSEALAIKANGGTILERGFYTYRLSGGVYTLVARNENGNNNCYYEDVTFTDTNYGWRFNGTIVALDDEVTIVDLTEELGEDASLEDLYDYYTDNTDKVELRLAFTTNPSTGRVNYIYVVEEGWAGVVNVALTSALKEAGWTVSPTVIYDDYSNGFVVTLTNNKFEMTGEYIGVVSETEGWNVGDNRVEIVDKHTVKVTVNPDWSVNERDDTIVLGLRPFEVTATMTDGTNWTIAQTGIQYVVPGKYVTFTLVANEGHSVNADGTFVVTLTDATNSAVTETVRVPVVAGQETISVDFIPSDWANYTVSVTWEA